MNGLVGWHFVERLNLPLQASWATEGMCVTPTGHYCYPCHASRNRMGVATTVIAEAARIHAKSTAAETVRAGRSSVVVSWISVGMCMCTIGRCKQRTLIMIMSR